MIQFNNTEVSNVAGALRGMRNPMQNHLHVPIDYRLAKAPDGTSYIGQDLALAKKLVLAGTDHSKFMRQIFVSVDITAPLYWWKEMDTYKICTTSNSESTMHTISKYPITPECFSFDAVVERHQCSECGFRMPLDEAICNLLENYRLEYLRSKDKRYWRALIQMLPSGWNQLRTWTANYQVLRNIYFARENHRLSEWEDFRTWISYLPYANELVTIKKEKAV